MLGLFGKRIIKNDQFYGGYNLNISPDIFNFRERVMNVLSLFDGMSCTQIALKNLGIKVDNYYASEIDKYAIEVARKNFPETIHLGDIKDITGSDFIRDIDLIVAGSPCQGFSFAGKQLAFDDPRSALFFEFVRLLKEVKPKYFLLENVRMKKEHLDVISQQVSEIYPECNNGSLFGIEPILINSAKLSAQNRNRFYWTNIPNVEQPEDLGIVLKDIIEDSFVSDRDKSYCIDASYYKGGNLKTYFKKSRRQLVFNTPKQVGVATDIKGFDIIKRIYSENGKSPTLTTMQGGHREPKIAVNSYREVRTEQAKKERKKIRKETGKDHTPFRSKKLVVRDDNKVGTVTPALNNDHKISFSRDNSEELTWRKLSVLECERLQTVPDNYTEGVSNSQRYKMLGNGFTVKVIEHILKNM
jgi:DNA-cytosine methyltransferase